MTRRLLHRLGKKDQLQVRGKPHLCLKSSTSEFRTLGRAVPGHQETPGEEGVEMNEGVTHSWGGEVEDARPEVPELLLSLTTPGSQASLPHSWTAALSPALTDAKYSYNLQPLLSNDLYSNGYVALTYTEVVKKGLCALCHAIKSYRSKYPIAYRFRPSQCRGAVG